MDSVDRSNPAIRAPVPRSDWALFLDIDGTLIDFAPRPDTVVVPTTLAPLLAGASNWLEGALAIVSGRPLSAIDRLLAPLHLPCASEHGAVLRLPDGLLLEANIGLAVPRSWRERIKTATKEWDGVLVGDKTYSVAVHYRQAPDRARDVRELVESVISEDPAFELLPAHMACEIRHRTLNKGQAVRALLKYPPFPGRVPIFVGDDVTDDDGIHAAEEMGGAGFKVEKWFGGPADVRRWLQSFSSETS
jgi:trehalose 6-phosphate phosphatase